jgi:hypothetical protein
MRTAFFRFFMILFYQIYRIQMRIRRVFMVDGLILSGASPKWWSDDMVEAMLLGWLRVHPRLCEEELGSFDLAEAVTALNEVVRDMRLSENKCKDMANPIQLLRQGFSEQLEAMLQGGCEREQIKKVMTRLRIGRIGES